MSKRDIICGRVVQLDPEKTENKMFAGCFLVITEAKSWGVQGYVQAIGEDGKKGGQAYYRAKYGTFATLDDSYAPWVIDEEGY